MYFGLLSRVGFLGLVFGGLELQNTITRALGLMIKSREIELTLVHGQKVGVNPLGTRLLRSVQLPATILSKVLKRMNLFSLKSVPLAHDLVK